MTSRSIRRVPFSWVKDTSYMKLKSQPFHAHVADKPTTEAIQAIPTFQPHTQISKEKLLGIPWMSGNTLAFTAYRMVRDGPFNEFVAWRNVLNRATVIYKNFNDKEVALILNALSKLSPQLQLPPVSTLTPQFQSIDACDNNERVETSSAPKPAKRDKVGIQFKDRQPLFDQLYAFLSILESSGKLEATIRASSEQNLAMIAHAMNLLQTEKWKPSCETALRLRIDELSQNLNSHQTAILAHGLSGLLNTRIASLDQAIIRLLAGQTNTSDNNQFTGQGLVMLLKYASALASDTAQEHDMLIPHLACLIAGKAEGLDSRMILTMLRYFARLNIILGPMDLNQPHLIQPRGPLDPRLKDVITVLCCRISDTFLSTLSVNERKSLTASIESLGSGTLELQNINTRLLNASQLSSPSSGFQLKSMP